MLIFDSLIDYLQVLFSKVFFLEPLTRAPYIFRPFLVLIILGIVSGILGVLVNLRNLEFVSEGIVHAIFPGIIGGFIVFNGAIGIIPGAILVGIAAAFIFTFSSRHKSSSESLIALTLTVFFGVGIVIVTYVKDMSGQLESLLFGRLLTVTDTLVMQTFFVCLASLCMVLVTWRKQIFRSFDKIGFQSSGFKLLHVDLILNMSLALVIIAASTAVGTLLAIGYVIIPPATAKLICNKVSTMVPVSILVAVLSGYFGLLSIVFVDDSINLSPQAMIVCFMTLFYVMAFAIRSIQKTLKCKVCRIDRSTKNVLQVES